MAWDYYRDLSTSIGDYHANVPSSLWTAIKTKLDAGTYNGSGSVSGISLYNLTVCNYPFQLVQVNEEKNCTMGSGSLKLANYYYYAGDNKAQYTLSNSTTMGFTGGGNSNNASSVIFAYNDSTHQACLVRLMTSYYSVPANEISYQIADNTQSHRETLYANLQGAIPVYYTWTSVPSISGKNGILSLVTLDSESINDGESVSGAAVSVFDQAPASENNVKNLADTYGSGEASSAVDVTAKYKVTLPPGGSFSVLKLVAKKDSMPNDASDGDKIVDISPSKTKKTVTGLDENSLYYFKIFAEDTNSNTSESDEKHIMTSGDEGWSFDYTGEIQTFVAPKTGVYSLETWGAQGGNASDGTNSARGGYGAYAYGEVLLTQGETLYINVGGQDGYGGGGVPPVVPPEYQAQIDQINGDSGSGYDFYWKSYTTWDGSHLVEAPFDNYSWSKKADESQNLVIDGRPFDTRYMYPNTKFDVYIDGEGSSYQLKLHDYQGREDGINWSGSRAYKCYANTTQMVGATPSTSYSYDYFLNNYVYYTGTISGCLDYIIANFRNVNIYVNGVQWASV